MPNSILTFDQKLLLNQIGEEIKIGLPGEEAQNKLAPISSKSKYRICPRQP